MQTGKVHFMNESLADRKFMAGLTGEADNHIGSDTHAGDALAGSPDQRSEL
jgi:hypothetical protein